MSDATRKIEPKDLSGTSRYEREGAAGELEGFREMLRQPNCRLLVRINEQELEMDERTHELVRLATLAGLAYEAERLKHDCFIDNATARTRFQTFLVSLEAVHPLNEDFPGEDWNRTIPWRVEIIIPPQI